MPAAFTKEEIEQVIPAIQQYFRTKAEDPTGLCCEDPLTYWTRKRQ